MNAESDLKMTALDYLTASPHLQMIKAALPYIHVPEQRFFSMIVKLSELERTMKLFEQKEDGMIGICSLEENVSDSPLDMLNAMKPYGTPQEQEFIDLIVNFIQGSRIYQSYRESAGGDSVQADSPERFKDGSTEDLKAEASSQSRREAPHFSIEHLKNMLPPEQQSRLETAQLLMQTMQNVSERV